MDRKEGQTLFEVTPEISHFAELCEKNNAIDKDLYIRSTKLKEDSVT